MRPLPRPRLVPARRPAVATALLVGALLTSACSGDTADVDELRDDLETQAQAQAALRERIGELESLLNAGDDSGAAALDSLSSLEEQLQTLTDELSQARLDLDEARTAAEDRTAQVDASLSSLETRISTLEEAISSLESTIAQVRNDLLSLRDDHELLRAEFDRHADHD